MNADSIREAYEAVCAEAGSGVTVVAATQYVSAKDMSVLAEAALARKVTARLESTKCRKVIAVVSAK